jgi:hypothetical protein
LAQALTESEALLANCLHQFSGLNKLFSDRYREFGVSFTAIRLQITPSSASNSTKRDEAINES